MMRTLALTLCLGIALPLCAQADPKDKEEKEARRQAKRPRKIEQQLRRGNREAGETPNQQRVELRLLP
jgi:hypothetical protein